MITPAYLKPGDGVAIVATARKVTKAEIRPAQTILESWGLDVKHGKNLFKSLNQFSGSDEERADDLQRALNNKNVQAILVARGGYGSVRIIDQIDFKRFNKNPKWIIGFSDVTVLHSHIHTICGVETIHAPMMLNIPNLGEHALSVLKDTLFGKRLSYAVSKQTPLMNKMNRAGTGKGMLVGGNLSLLYSLIGSPSDIDTNGKILFIEDLDEYLYHIDRMMMNLKRTGKLKNLAGLIVGGMTEMKDNTVPYGKTAEEIIAEHVAEYNYPVCYGFRSGHVKDNYPLIMGREVSLKVGERVELIF